MPESIGQPAWPSWLSIPTNLQADFVDAVDFGSVSEVYGQLPASGLGGGRASVTLPVLHSARQFADHVRAVRDRGVSFNYLLNASCLDNMEFSRSGHALIEREIKQARDFGADIVTVTIPHLVAFIKRVAPGLKVSISTMAGVDSPEMAAFFEDLGADRITLSFTDVNRDFQRLKAIRKRVSLNLQVLANLECLRGCPYTRYHANIQSHASQEGHGSGGLIIDSCYLRCSLQRMKDPAQYLISGFIRPEDQKYYFDVGINSIKLVNRTMATDVLARAVLAYSRCSYHGNLFDLFSHPSHNIAYSKGRLFHLARYLLRPARVNPARLWAHRLAFQIPKPYLDNNRLDGFISQFIEGRCHMENCGAGCRYCHEWASRTLTLDEAARQAAISRLKSLDSKLVSGGLFRYW